MRIKDGFVLRTICGQDVISGEGLERVNFSKIVSLNATASYVWKALQGMEFSAEDVRDLLLDKYDVDETTAMNDAVALCGRWKELGLAE